MGIKDFFGRSKSTEVPKTEQPTNVATGVTKTDLAIINKIVGEFKDRSRKQVRQWRDAMTATESIDNPRWYLLQDIFDDMIDAHLASVIDTRKMSTTNHRFYVVDKKTGEQLEEQTNFLNKKWFFDAMDYALDSINKKYTYLQFLRNGDSIQVVFIPRRNICPQNNRLYTEVSGDRYIDLSLEKDVIGIIHHSDFGILNDVVPNWIWKKNALQAWAEFGEKFGMPLITATTANKQDIARIETMLKKMGEAAQAVLPTGTTVDVHDLANRGNVKGVYEGQAAFHNNEISKRFLGGTMVSDNGSSRSQSEVHERTLDDKIAVADKRFFTFMVNDQLFPVLQLLGFPFDNTKMAFQYDETESLSLSEHWKIVSDAAEKFEFDDKGVEWIAKTFNIPITGVKQNAAPANPGQSFNNATTTRALAVANGIDLPDYFTPSLRAQRSNPSAATSNKSLLDELDVFDQQIASFLYNDKITEADRQRLLKSKRVAEDIRDGLFSGWGNRRTEINWNAPDHRALAAMEMNLFRFADAKTRAEVVLINGLLIDKEKNEIRSEADFIAQAKKVNSLFNETHLSVERNFAIATGQTSARWFEFMGEKNTVKTWQYQTAGDDHVRPGHAALDGRIFYFDDVEARRVWPPNGIECRCEGNQHLGKPGKELMTGNDAVQLAFASAKEREMYGINRADAGVVFQQNQMYLGTLKDAKGKKSFGKPINDYTFTDYGLKKWKDIDGLTALKLDKTITPDNVGELFSDNAGTGSYKAMGFDDYLKRKLIIKENTFAQHTKGKYVTDNELRHQLFPHISDVLTSPDEMYLRNYAKGDKEQLRYIKFYNDQVLTVDCEVTNDALEIKTWYQQKVDDSKLRTGMLINAKNV
jgi:SPP1 gp7 family putative phage head morphogenesis protein